MTVAAEPSVAPSTRHLNGSTTQDQSPTNGTARNGVAPIDAMQYVETISIPDVSRDRLHTAMMSLPSPYSNFQAHRDGSLRAVMTFLPLDVISTIQAFHSSFNGPGALHIRCLPTDNPLSPTPAKGDRATDKQSFISEACLTGVASIIGDVYSYATEKDGELIHNVCPVKSGETNQSNESSKVNLDLHIENAYFESRPDYLALYCLRQDHAKIARTSLADVRVAIQKLSPEIVDELRRPVYLTPSPESHHKAQGGVKWSAPNAIIQGDPESPTMLCSFPGMKVLDKNGEEALDQFEEAINHSDVVFSIALQPGEILLLNNRRVVHGRTYFEARYDGTDRWLQRVYIRGDQDTACHPWPENQHKLKKMGGQ